MFQHKVNSKDRTPQLRAFRSSLSYCDSKIWHLFPGTAFFKIEDDTIALGNLSFALYNIHFSRNIKKLIGGPCSFLMWLSSNLASCPQCTLPRTCAAISRRSTAVLRAAFLTRQLATRGMLARMDVSRKSPPIKSTGLLHHLRSSKAFSAGMLWGALGYLNKMLSLWKTFSIQKIKYST